MVAPAVPLSRELIGESQILIGVVLFGISFIGQKHAMSTGIGPLTYNACRFTISSILLLVFRPWLQSVTDSEYENVSTDDANYEKHRDNSLLIDTSPDNSGIDELSTRTNVSQLKLLWFWGTICGLANFLGSVLQQESLVSIPVATCGFITGSYVIAVPICEMFIPGRSAHIYCQSWVAAVASVIGMYFISGCGSAEGSCLAGAEGRGEILVFISMFCWVVSILASDAASKLVDCISLTCVDFAICTVFNILLALWMEPEQWKYPFTEINSCWSMILLVGFTEAAAFTSSTLGQMYTPG
jgi:drug/metabolite transporter (DMT)-like permease